MSQNTFFILLAFLGFSQVFSSVMTQVIERMFETIGLHSPTPDLGDTIERSWTNDTCEKELVKIGMKESKQDGRHDNSKDFAIPFQASQACPTEEEFLCDDTSD